VGLTLGSGLGGVIEGLEHATVFRSSELPHWPPPTVAGHAGRLALAHWRDVPIVALSGRSHRYEGYSLDRVTFAVRVMAALGARVLIFTNAVGATHSGYVPGDLMLATDHINFIGKQGLFAPAELAERWCGRRVAEYYDPRLRELLLAAAARAGVRLHLGTLMGFHGPSFETAAEVRMAFAFGADMASMSTVHEVTMGAELGCRCACISCVTNLATGLSDDRVTHGEVAKVAHQAAPKLEAVLDEFLKSIELAL
jgi:purine-nucleoside phosphorylase